MRNKHVGFVVEQEMYEQLHAAARDEYRSVSNLLYRMTKNWLRKHSSKQKRKGSGS